MNRFNFKNISEEFEEDEEYDLEDMDDYEGLMDENPLTEEETLEVKQLCDFVNESDLEGAKKLLDCEYSIDVNFSFSTCLTSFFLHAK